MKNKNRKAGGKPSKKPIGRTCPTDPKKPIGRTCPTDQKCKGAQAQRKRDFTVTWIDPWALETPTINDAIYGRVEDDAHMEELVESMKEGGNV